MTLQYLPLQPVLHSRNESINKSAFFIKSVR